MSEQEPPRREDPQPEHKEGEAGYYQAARYPIERPAKQAYSAAQALVFSKDGHGLSAYKFYLPDAPRKPNVTVLGDPPPVEVHEQISQILQDGTPLVIPMNVLHVLFERREQANQINDYVEGHHRPGRAFHISRHEGE